jgi:uncharacterized protein YbcV (DUF1398 family)
MDSSVTAVLEQCAHDSYAGSIGFDMVVERLAGVGIEAYLADFRAGTTTYYLPGGDTHALPMRAPPVAIAGTFDEQLLQAAIRGAQLGEVKYPEFLERAMGAGCVGYVVWIAGQHASYFGRRGEFHVEPFQRTA